MAADEMTLIEYLQANRRHSRTLLANRSCLYDRRVEVRTMQLNLRLSTVFVISWIFYAVVGQEIPSFFFSVNPTSQDVVEGREVRLYCDVSDRSGVTFTWTLNGKLVTRSNRRFQEDSTLRILRVMRGADDGLFTCIASHTATSYSIVSQEARLNIQWIEDSVKLELRRPKSKNLIVAGSEMMLKCQITGNPEPSYLFYHNSFRLFPNDRIKILDENRIRISSLTAADNGVYSCQAENNAGRRESTSNLILNLKVPNGPRLIESKFTPLVTVQKNLPASIHCPFINATRIKWFFNQNEKLANDSRHKLFSNGTLYFPKIRPIDEGVYRCEGLKVGSPSQAFSVTLKIMFINNFPYESFEPRLRRHFPIVVPVNSRFEMKCFPPDGNPKVKLSWLDRNKMAVPRVGPISMSNDGLVFERIQQVDSGNYTCVARNAAGEKRETVSIVVSIPPSIMKVPRPLEILEQGKAMFECNFKGTPYPVTVITWTKDTVKLKENRRYMVDKKRGRLKISSVRVEDAGNYACEVNTTGHEVVISSSAYLTVKRKLKFKPVPRDTTLDLNSASKIECHAESDTPTTVRWLKGDRKLDLPSHVKDAQGILLFDGVKRSDAGTYMCVAHSATQGFINTSIKVEVIVKPRFEVRPKNTTVFEGQSVTLHCIARGEPKPKIVWDKDKRIKSKHQNRFTILTNGSLHVSAVYRDDQGVYGCTANSSGGLIRAEAYLMVDSEEEWRRKYPHGKPHDGHTEEEGMSMMKTVIIAVCSAGAYLALVIGLTAFCSYRLVTNRKKRKSCGDKPVNGDVNTREQMELLGNNPEHESTTQVKSDSDNRSHVSGMSSQPSHSSQSAQARSRRGSYDRLQFPRHDLETIGKLGQGVFGEVYLAKAHGIRNNEAETLVVVKSFLAKEQPLYLDFRQEMEMYSHMDHENVASLLGVCREMDPHLCITEYCEWGDLKQFLLATRQDNGKRMARVTPLTFDQKIGICHQVAQGMDYITRNRYIHRDLASRNVLLSPRLGVKITNLALCKDVYACEYYAHKNTLIPLRWMPPEAVVDDEFSVKSDVWSYGVFLWEVFTSGDIPYKSRSDEEVMKGMKVGDVSLEFGEQCTDEVIDLIHKCTSESAEDRPLFSLVCLMISDLLMVPSA